MTKQNNINTGIRIASMVFDHIIMGMIAMAFSIPMMVKLFLTAFTISHEPAEIDVDGPLFYIALAGFTLYFCKDSINGRSIGKRIFKIQVVDNTTEEAASPVKCFVRNIFCVIWPVEVIAALINPGRRLGDRIAGTKIIAYDPMRTMPYTFDIKKVILPLALAYAFVMACMLPFQNLNQAFSEVQYVESSYNDAESKALEKLFSDSCGQYMSASFNVFNTMKNGNKKYISAIYMLKENYLDDREKTEQLKQTADRLLYSRYSEGTVTGKAQYVFKTNESIEISISQIGTAIQKEE
jgi:uncharacterized RDD family membrane protein YckC